ncbi:hypothetical protein M407DRAFT_28835 [Tulasnella calospora MUT 4182]|uniref:Uncharacterized protein n=1 Tax=Tulasnella calospora MUT 4182 TaxID=1051891 RepID=A0A0C3LJG9_9AGAM|nr:hypothetical protein M407DRAFT_29877 [Tulasnella calospora MUT 4182]KIO21562.1 hypothetical protein M407DRAFT_28835 [Tulasnella calospora MUT 4182]
MNYANSCTTSLAVLFPTSPQPFGDSGFVLGGYVGFTPVSIPGKTRFTSNPCAFQSLILPRFKLTANYEHSFTHLDVLRCIDNPEVLRGRSTAKRPPSGHTIAVQPALSAPTYRDQRL